MEASDSVAVVALVVSLIALFIASLQLLQQLFGTAEGYRRCAPSVMGPWANTRRRRWNLTEFRFEVQYMTPHFVLLPSNPNDKDEKSTRRVYKSTFNLLGISKHRENPAQTPHISFWRRVETQVSRLLGFLWRVSKWVCVIPIRWRTLARPFQVPSIDKIRKIVEETVSLYAEHVDQNPDFDEREQAEKQATDSVLVQQDLNRDEEMQSTENSLKSGQSSQGLYEPKDEVRVSWLQLLGALHDTYRTYYTADMMPQTPDNSNRTDAAIAVRMWNWDFMPSDLLRPLATSTLNNVILFALRLNMRWRKLDLQTGVFLADGNGYSLSSVEVRGLGIVFRFSVDGQRDEDLKVHKAIPSKAVDKMMFGIVPGCPVLVKGRDFPLVDRFSRVGSFPPESLLQDIGFDDQRQRDEIAGKNWGEPHNELIVLLSCFLPLPDCPVLFHSFSAWTADPITSPLHFYAGRLAFVEQLEDRVQEAANHNAMSSLRAVLDCFEQLKRNWRNDFFGRFNRSAIENFDDMEKLKLSKECQDMFDWTTAWFQGRVTDELAQDKRLMQTPVDNVGNDGNSEKHIRSKNDWTSLNEGRTRYIDLVAGHTNMSFHAVSHVLKNTAERREGSLASDERRKKHRADFDYEPRTISTRIQYHIATQYVRYLKHDNYGVSKHLRSKGVGWGEDEIEAAWWVMILRGIVWDMATMGDRNHRGRRGCWVGERVPSFYYDMTTPVWIT